jgi:nicotinamidase-related amidase
MAQGSAAGGLVCREEAVLVVVDVQQRLAPAIAECDRVVANIVKLLRFARIVGLPVICTEQIKLGDTVEAIRAELGGIAPIQKADFGCFGCGEFVEALRGLGRRTLVLTGIEAHICVLQTALGALPDYAVHAVADAMSSRAPENRDLALERMRQAGVTVTATEMVMYEVLRRAGTDEFRAVLQLVKEG